MKTTKKYTPRTSDVLVELSKTKGHPPTISYEEVLKTLGIRAFGILVIFFSLPNLLPFGVIPGISFLFSIPIAFFAVEMLLGQKTFWIPKKLAKKTMSRAKISHMIKKLIPYIQKIEKIAQPRLSLITTSPFDRINALFILSLALLLMLPIPFSNFIIGSIITLLSLGIMEKDGLLLSISYILVALYYAFLISVFTHAFSSLV